MVGQKHGEIKQISRTRQLVHSSEANPVHETWEF